MRASDGEMLRHHGGIPELAVQPHGVGLGPEGHALARDEVDPQVGTLVLLHEAQVLLALIGHQKVRQQGNDAGQLGAELG